MHLCQTTADLCLRTFLIATLLTTCGVLSVIQEATNSNRENETDPDSTPGNPKQSRWAAAALDYLQSLDCTKTTFASERECDVILQMNSSEMNVYIADPLAFDKYVTVVPLDDLESDTRHDVVLVLDPYPEVNFGHLVLVFYIDLYVQKSWCLQDKGTILGKC